MPRGGYRNGAGRKPGPTPRTRAIRARLAHDLELTAERVVEEIRRLAFSDIGQVFDERGQFKALADIPPEVRAGIASIKVTKKNLTAGDDKQEDVVEVRLWDKLRALEMAAKHHGLLVEKLDVSGTVTFAEKIQRARTRLRAARDSTVS